MLNRNSLSKQVYALLKEMIILQQTPGLQMGERINEAAIAKTFNCSVTPVREAINMLRRDGLIVGDSYQSSSIVLFTPKDVEDFFEVRECLELFALRLGFCHITDKDLEVMRKAQTAYQDAYIHFDQGGIIDSNRVFHNMILQLADNKVLRSEINGIAERIAMIRAPIAQRRNAEGNREQLLLPVREHGTLLHSLEMRDLVGAEAALRAHLDRVREDSRAYYANYSNANY